MFDNSKCHINIIINFLENIIQVVIFGNTFPSAFYIFYSSLILHLIFTFTFSIIIHINGY